MKTKEFTQRVDANQKRGQKIANNARKAKRLRSDLQAYITSPACQDLEGEELQYLVNFRKALGNCSNLTLIRQYSSNNAIEFMGAMTCKHKLCPVCNAERQRLVRQRYWKFLEGGEMKFPVYETVPAMYKRIHQRTKTGRLKYKRVIKKDTLGYPIFNIRKTNEFDFMHLTLTVKHSKKGWRGERFYAMELMKEFNYMRKKTFWKNSVFAGEFGIEVTAGENGLHIHIHALLLAYKSRGNRNRLYRNILKAWNKQTANKYDDSTYNEKAIEGIYKSLGRKNEKDLTTEDLELVKKLRPSGSTMVHLESLFIYSKKKLSHKDRWIKDKQKWKHYVNQDDPSQFMKGILECIKYHFEPVGLKKRIKKKRIKTIVQETKEDHVGRPIYSYFENQSIELTEYDGLYEFGLIREILPKLYGKPLYKKFGAFHGVDCLNIASKIEDEVNDAIDDFGRETSLNPETAETEDPKYIVCNATCLGSKTESSKMLEIRRGSMINYLKVKSLKEAWTEIINLSINQSSEEIREWQNKPPDNNNWNPIIGFQESNQIQHSILN